MDSPVLLSTLALGAALVGVLSILAYLRVRRAHTHQGRARLLTDDLLARHRTIVLRDISENTAVVVVAKLMHLDKASAEPIALYLDSVGGHVVSAFMIRDLIGTLRAPVYTHCLGEAHGVALVLLAHGVRGHRTASPRAKMAYAPFKSPDESVRQPEIERLQTRMVEMLAEDTCRPPESVEADIKRLRKFDARQAKAYGLVDRIEE